MPTAAAIAGAGVLGAVASDRASSKARRTQVEAGAEQARLIREGRQQAEAAMDRDWETSS